MALMASMTMTSSCLLAISKLLVTISRNSKRSLTLFKAFKGENTTSLENKKQGQGMKMRRGLVFTAAVCSLAKLAMAEEEEPERGTEAAMKKYALVCVTMPTAKICRN